MDFLIDKAPPIGREGLDEICQYELEKNTYSAITKRAVASTAFAAICRGGEISDFTWNCCTYNSISKNIL